MWRLTAGLLVGLWLCGVVWGDAREIGLLREQSGQVAGQVDSLDQMRLKVRAEAELLSARIDSLKAGPVDEAPELQESLRASMGLVQRLVEIERRAATLQARQDSLREQLRLAYDWEIGVLIQRLAEQRDPGLLAQLVIYQDEREALGSRPLETELRFGAELAIGPEDGPEEIRQKMELMQGISARLREEARRVGEQLRRLEAEERLRTRVRVFADELSLFDEHLPEGRVLAKVAAAPTLGAGPAADAEAAGDDLKGAAPGDRGGQVATNAVSFLVLRRETSRDTRAGSLAGPTTDDTVLEIRKLKARLQEIHELEAIVGERADAFRASLDRLLEGRE
jgi:hypothetical protein